MPTAPHIFKRLVLGLQPSASERSVRLAVTLAEMLDLELLGLFLEDESLRDLAAIPFARELRLLGGGWHPLDLEGLSRELHPLFATRGVPGTHDTRLGGRVLDALTTGGGPRTVKLPAFDKARDDRLPESAWPQVEAPIEVVLFEGWCVGARAQEPAALAEPVNALEADEDAGGVWRSAVNARLESDYAELFARLDWLVMLRIPSFDKVFEWRGLQERKLRRRLEGQTTPDAGVRGQSEAELRRFIQH